MVNKKMNVSLSKFVLINVENKCFQYDVKKIY